MQYDLTPFQDYEMLEKPEELLEFRFHIEDARAKLKEIMDSLDEFMILRMKELGIASFEYGPDERRKLVKYGKTASKKVDTAKMLHYLRSGTDDEREMASRALSSGQSAWKATAVQEMADTLGIQLVETTFKDKIILKVIPKENVQ